MKERFITEVVNSDTSGLYMIDLPVPLPGFAHQITSWLLQDRQLGINFLVDVGTACSVTHLEKALSELGVVCLDYILLTHIHIDHAGGIGHLVKSFPEAKVLAPEKGHKHLVDPARLWEGSLKTLGDMVLAFGKMLPLPEDALSSGPEYPERLRVLDTPGHAPHHQSFIYSLPEGNILFAGEAAGVVLNMDMLPRWMGGSGGTGVSMPGISVPSVPDVAYMYPATPPVFNPDVARKSLRTLIAEKSSIVCYGHYGYSRYPAALDLHMRQLDLWEGVIRGIMRDLQSEERILDEAESVLLHSDGFLSVYSAFAEDVRGKERLFLRNSILGFIRSLAGRTH